MCKQSAQDGGAGPTMTQCTVEELSALKNLQGSKAGMEAVPELVR